jgi:hypothetical protein
MTTEVAQHLSTGGNHLLNWLKQVWAVVIPCQNGIFFISGCLNQATAKTCRRNLWQQAYSLFPIITIDDGRAGITRFMLLPGLSHLPEIGLTSRRPSLPMKHSPQGGRGSVLGYNKHLKFIYGVESIAQAV